MERLTAPDAWFLYLESATMPLHVTGLLLLDPSTAPKGFSFDQLRRHVDGRLDAMPMLRRRLVEVPAAIDHACWIEDPEFDLDRHVHRHVLSGAGTERELAAFIGGYSSVRLNRKFPLWDMVVVEGLDDGNVALVMKMHHCIVDGVTGMTMMGSLMDLTPKPKRPRRHSDWTPERVPGSREVIASATWHRLTTPMRPVRAVVDVSSSLARLAGTAAWRRISGAEAAAHPLNAPRTCVNGSITARRAVAFDRRPIEDFKAIRSAFGVTINDVVLAACTFGLRRHLEVNDRVPDRPLVCSVPVSTHGHDRADRSSNQVSDMFVHLPVQLADPVAQLRSIHTGSLGAKQLHESIGTDMIRDVIELVPATIFHLVTRLYSMTGLASRLAPVHNVIVSNVIGSPVKLFLAGAEVVGMFPFGPLIEGSGLNITVLSNNGEMNFGLIACPDLVADFEGLLDNIGEGIDALLEAAVSQPR